MLTITVPDVELFDEESETFINYKGGRITLEHSLRSISKWETKYCKPFINPDDKRSSEENIYYFKCMTITDDVPEYLYHMFTMDNYREINEYINSELTATTISIFGEEKKKGTAKVITSEQIYYWMISYGIPMECQDWHLSRLLTLIKVFNVNNSDEKLSKEELYERQRRINAEARARMK